MSGFVEALKYFTALFQIKTNYLRYIRAVFLYRLKRKAEFPRAFLNLEGAKFVTRENSMDIAHLSSLYERETTRLLMDMKPKIFIDIGAHVGRFSIILAKKGSKVISVEPSKSNFNQLNKNIKLNSLQDSIIALNVGCSDKKGKETLYFVSQNEGLSSLEKKDNATKETIMVKRLDEICRELKLSPESISVIKADVEGFELNVLKGAARILRESSPILVIEITDKGRERKIREFLDKFGFSCKKVLDFRNFVFAKR